MTMKRILAVLGTMIFLAALLAAPSWAQDDASTADSPVAEEGGEAAQPVLDPEDPIASVTGPIDLGEAVRRGLTYNPQIEAARFQLSGSEYGRRSQLGAFGPAMTAGYGYERLDREPTTAGRVVGSRDRWAFTLNVTQPVFRGFELLSRYQRAKIAKEQAEAQLTNAELTLVRTIQTTFLDLLKGRMDVKSAEDSVARLTSQLQVTQAFFDVGLRPKLDVLQAEVDLATAEQTLLVAKNEVATQTARLNTLIGLPLEYPTEYVGELTYLPFMRSLDDCLATAFRQRPDLQIGRKSVEIAQQDAKITASDFYPDVNATYNYSQTGDSPELKGNPRNRTGYSSWSVGAQASWTFFEWGRTYNAYQESKEIVARVEAELANTRLDASFEVKQNLLDLQEAADRIGVARKSVEAAQEGYRMAVARYQAQVGTNTDVLDAQSRVSSAEFNLTQALSDYQSALADIYVAMGIKNTALIPN